MKVKHLVNKLSTIKRSDNELLWDYNVLLRKYNEVVDNLQSLLDLAYEAEDLDDFRDLLSDYDDYVAIQEDSEFRLPENSIERQPVSFVIPNDND
nr:MAG TPA: hypothetical protein [Caudoviricetes sp.]